MKSLNVSKNPDTAETELTIKTTSKELSFMHEAVSIFIERQFGDVDDIKKVEFHKQVKKDLLELMKLY